MLDNYYTTADYAKCNSEFPKKVELHVHLDGTITHKTAWELVRSKQLPLPGNGTYEDFSKALLITEPESLHHFLSPYKYITPAYAGDMAANERIAYEYCMNAAKDNIIYAEVRFSPHKSLGEKEYNRLGFAGLEAVVEAVIRGIERGEKDFGITVKVLLTAYYGWSYGDQFEVLKLCQKYDKVVGMDLCTKQPDNGVSDEAPVTAELLFLFEEAKKTGVKTTIHAGEASGPKAIERAKDYYRCDRIGHGYHAVQDPVIYKSCLEEKIHLECCPWSSLLTAAVKPSDSHRKHPIVRFAEDEANFSLNSDDPTFTGKFINGDFILAQSWGLTKEQISQSILNAALASFLPENEKSKLVKEIASTYHLKY
ncbi:adenosine deaminase [Nilaparvata lugens]|uniref:adenosine deaminase n=1 Tax=Nilaparvata lugens TaxID=108931 RepID=UPI00193E9B56|nr:adenosine deaminase [Nilaparvata lugens]